MSIAGLEDHVKGLTEAEQSEIDFVPLNVSRPLRQAYGACRGVGGGVVTNARCYARERCL